jgi:hypothetical protein
MQCPPDAGAGVETGMKPNGLDAARVDDLPDVDAEVLAQDRQLVDQRDVDVPEGVLEQLGHLGRLRRADAETFSTKPP